MNNTKAPYKIQLTEAYRVEKYTGDRSDYYKLFRNKDGKHIATFYSESALERYVTN